MWQKPLKSKFYYVQDDQKIWRTSTKKVIGGIYGKIFDQQHQTEGGGDVLKIPMVLICNKVPKF